MSKYGLCFDPNDPDLSVAEQDTIGSFVLGKDGDAVTSTTIGGVEALDVNIAGGNLTIAAGSEYAEDSAHADTDTGTYNLSVRQDVLAASTDADGDYQSVKSDALGRLYVTDDQALSQLTDINTELDGLTTLVTATNTALSDVNSELDAQTALLTTIDTDTGAIALSTAATTTALGDVNTELDAQTALLTDIDADTGAIATSTASLDTAFAGVLNVAGDAIQVEGDFGGSCNIAIANSQNTVAATEASVVASALADRKSMWIANEGKATAYIGNTGVTASTGFPLYRKTAIELCAGPAVDVKAISSAVGADLRVLELS